MKTGIFYHKRTGEPVQIIARAQTKPTFQEVICYQELTKPYEHFVMEKRQFFSEYVKEFAELPLQEQKQLPKREDLPDKQPRISKGEVASEPEEETEEQAEEQEPEVQDPKVQSLIAFFDADTYREKKKLFEDMKGSLDEHMLNNIAVSLDLSIEDSTRGYSLILSELEIRSRYEDDRRKRN
ncbi:MAG: hypothetical protein J1F02_04945 [Lachnospiraceae bacterium]|nr:hypothetical protein [Lachnospiraceae bacterium]